MKKFAVIVGVLVMCLFASAQYEFRTPRSPGVPAGAPGGPLDPDTLLHTNADDSVDAPYVSTGDWSNKGSVWLDVRAYGATGDGVTDDTAAIQATIDAAADGATVFFPTGNYYVSSPFTMTSKRLTFLGAGHGSQIFQSADDHLFSMLYGSGAAFCRWIGLALGSAATTEGKAIFYFESRGNAIIQDVWLYGGYYGIYLYGSIGNYVKNLRSRSWSGRFFANTGRNDVLIKADRDTIHYGGVGKWANKNSFRDIDISGSVVGIDYAYGTCSFDEVMIQGSALTSTDGAIFSNVTPSCLRLKGFHLEFADGTLSGEYMLLDNIHNCVLENIRMGGNGTLKFRRCRNVEVIGSYCARVEIDKSSSHITIGDMLTDIITDEGGASEIYNATDTTNPAVFFGGISRTAYTNILDGDLENWTVNAPRGFSRLNCTLVMTGAGEVDTRRRLGSYAAEMTQTGATSYMYITISGEMYKQYAIPNAYNLSNSEWAWQASAVGSQYYLTTLAGGDPELYVKPMAVWENDIPIPEGDASGGLSAGEWDYGDFDSLGYNTIYIRLTDSTDPDSKATEYVLAAFHAHELSVAMWAWQPDGSTGRPSLDVNFDGPLGAGGNTKNFNVSSDQWTRVRFTTQIDPASTSMDLRYGVASGAASDTIYLDGLEAILGGGIGAAYTERGINGDYRIGGTLRVGAVETTGGFPGEWLPVYNNDDDLEMFLPFTMGTGSVVYDRSRYSRTANANNVSWVDGLLGNALQFNGTTSLINFGDVLDQDTGDFTLMAWAKSSVTPGGANNGIIYKRTTGGATDQGYSLWMPDGRFRFRMADGVNSETVTSAYGFDDGEWHHVVGIADRSNNRQRLYVDGVLEDTNGESIGTLNNAVNFSVGALRTGFTLHVFDGDLDEIRVFDKALGLMEVKAHYLSGIQAHSLAVADTYRILNSSGVQTFEASSTNVRAVGTPFISTSVVIPVDDATPDVSGGNIFVTSANDNPTAITDLDSPVVNQVVRIICGSTTNASTIADGGNFSLSANWNPASVGDNITLWVRADNDYVELSRTAI